MKQHIRPPNRPGDVHTGCTNRHFLAAVRYALRTDRHRRRSVHAEGDQVAGLVTLEAGECRRGDTVGAAFLAFSMPVLFLIPEGSGTALLLRGLQYPAANPALPVEICSKVRRSVTITIWCP
jgi:uncharacterized protein (UPF0261 family)